MWSHAVSRDPRFKATIDAANVGAAIVPELTAGTSGRVNGFEGDGINRFSKNQAAAASFILETVSAAAQKVMNLSTGGYPRRAYSCSTIPT